MKIDVEAVIDSLEMRERATGSWDSRAAATALRVLWDEVQALRAMPESDTTPSHCHNHNDPEMGCQACDHEQHVRQARAATDAILEPKP